MLNNQSSYSKHYRQLAMFAGFAVGLFASASAYAAEYYVSPSGSDSNPGTLAAPWKTPKKALGYALNPGDTVWFRGGDYIIESYLTFNKKGTQGSPITYKNYNGETPTIVYNGPPREARIPIAFISGNYSIVDGINFRLPEEMRRKTMIDNTYIVSDGRANTSAVAGPALYGTGVILRNCHVDNFSQSGAYNKATNGIVENCRFTNNGSHGLYIAGKNSVFRYNILDGSRAYSNQQGFQIQYETAVGNKIYGNTIINGQASGFVISGRASYNEVFNNVFINAGGKSSGTFGYAISVFCEDGIPKEGNKVYNNTFIGKTNSGLIAGGTCTSGLTKCDFHSPDGFSSEMTRAECNAELARKRPIAEIIEIRDNIFYPSSPVPVSPIGAGLNSSMPSVKNNIFYNVKGSVPAGNMLVDPKLENPRGVNAKGAMLLAGSPAIDKASNSSIPPFDYQHGVRPINGISDIGAFEFGSPAGSGGPLDYTPIGVTPSAPVLLGPNGEICPTGF
jgi:hypothetical protein